MRGKPAQVTTNGTRSKENPLSVPTEESPAWDATNTTDSTAGWGDSTSTPTASESTAAAVAAPAAPATSATSAVRPKPSVVPDGTPKTWASMLRQSTAAKLAPKAKEPPAPKPAESAIEPLPPIEPTPAEQNPPTTGQPTAEPAGEQAPSEIPAATKPEVALPPSTDRLTQTNLEHVDDESHPPETETVRSEAADSWNPHASAVTTPLSGLPPQQQASRAPSSGFAATAIKATERNTARIPSYQRRILDQEEAVRMPGNRDQVDRATVQFGSLNLNGPLDEDIDGDREEPETRAQPPVDSPVAHPRTSLPPIQPAPVPDPYASQKPAAALPPPSGPTIGTAPLPSQFFRPLSANAASAAPTAPVSQPALASQGVLPSYPNLPPPYDLSLTVPFAPAAQAAAQNTQQFGRFGQAAPQEPSSFPSQKQFDTFGQQPTAAAATQSQYEGAFPSQPQQSQPQSQQQPGGAPGGAFSSASGDYSSYYTADQHSRTPYNYYNQQFGQQLPGAQGQQEGLASQQQQQQQQQPQRSFSGYNAHQNDGLNQYPQGGVHNTQGRYGAASAVEPQTSGNTTPNPSVTQAQQQAGQGTQAQSHGQQQQPHDYPYSHPYFGSPYYAAYVNQQYQGGYNQAGYAGPYGKAGAVYGQPHQYGMSPQGPYGHASSPAGGFGQNSLHRADSAGVAAGLGEYGRAGSAQSGNQPGLGATGFSGMHDTFSRGASAYQSQASGQPFNGPASQQGNPPTGNDDLKPFGESKAGAGPSPSLGAAARPGSATNNAPTGLPPPQSNQQGGLGMSGYGGYPSHLQGHGLHGNQTAAGGYGMSASGGQAGHSNTPYGGYGAQGFSGSYYANAPRGWGGNYH